MAKGDESGISALKKASSTKAFDVDALADKLETYVGGGYDLDGLLDQEDIQWMNAHERSYSQPMVRLEDKRFTASAIDSMDDDDDISLGGTYRSFTRGGQSTIDQLGADMEEAGYDLNDMVAIRVVGTKSGFDMAKYAQNYQTDQKEVLLGGNYEYMGEGYMTVNGKRLRRIDLRQMDW